MKPAANQSGFLFCMVCSASLWYPLLSVGYSGRLSRSVRHVAQGDMVYLGDGGWHKVGFSRVCSLDHWFCGMLQALCGGARCAVIRKLTSPQNPFLPFLPPSVPSQHLGFVKQLGKCWLSENQRVEKNSISNPTSVCRGAASDHPPS